MRHCPVVIWVAKYILNLILVSFLAHFKHQVLRVHLFHEVADHCSVFRYCNLVFFIVSVFDAYVIYGADRKYPLFEVLQLDQIVRVRAKVAFFNLTNLFCPFICLEDVFIVDWVAACCKDARHSNEKSHLFQGTNPRSWSAKHLKCFYNHRLIFF